MDFFESNVSYQPNQTSSQLQCFYQEQQQFDYDQSEPNELQIASSLENHQSFENNLIEENNPYYGQVQNQMPPKPRKRRRKQINYVKRKRRNINKKQNKREPIPFSYIEDRAILIQVLQLGPKFHKIAKEFPGRTLSMVKNRYYKTLRFKWDFILGQNYAHLNASLKQLDDTESQHGYEESIGYKREDTYVYNFLNQIEY